MFVTLEDEAGVINVVVWRDLAERQRRELVGSRLLAVDSKWERVDGVEHLIANRLHNMTSLLGNAGNPIAGLPLILRFGNLMWKFHTKDIPLIRIVTGDRMFDH